MTVAIRDADPADAALVATIYVESWNRGFTGLMPARAMTPAEVERWCRDISLAGVRWRVALVGETVVGFAGTGPSRDPVEAGLGELDTIAVDPVRWRTGVGTALMDDALDGLAASYRSAILWTLSDYPRGEAFYRRTGWLPDGRTRSQGRQVSYRHDLSSRRTDRPDPA